MSGDQIEKALEALERHEEEWVRLAVQFGSSIEDARADYREKFHKGKVDLR